MEDRHPDMPAAPSPPPADPPNEEPAPAPVGALAVVGFLTLTIAVFWFGMYALNIVRN
jgi:hypothetical protein